MEYIFTVTPTGYIWSQQHPTWGDVTYTAIFKGDTWTEFGEAMKDGKKVRFYEMNLKRKR